MRSATVGTRLVLVFLAYPVLLACLTPVASGQDPERSARLVLTAIPVAHAPSDDLRVRLRVVNEGEEPLDGFRLTVGAGDVIRSRSELHESFDSATLFTSFPLDFPDRTIPAGGSETIRIDNPVADLIALTSEGVHPLSFSLFSVENSFTPLDSITTQLMVYPSEPQEPLSLVPLLTLDDDPARAPDGTFFAPAGQENPLEQALAERGWLTAIAAGLDAATASGNDPPPLRLGFAPTPRFVEELAAMAEGYVRSTEEEREEVGAGAPTATAASEVLELLQDTIARPSVQPILTPYAFPDLPTLEERLTGGDVALQLTEAISAIDAALDIRLDRGWVFPPAGRLDVPSLEALQTAGVTDGVFFAPASVDALEDPAGSGCPIAVLSFTCSIRVATDIGGAIQGYVSDADLQARMIELTEPGAGRLETQRLLAESAMIHAEQPGTSGRIVQLTIPGTWRPAPTEARTLLEALRDAPWIATETPAEGLDTADRPIDRSVQEDAETMPEAPDEAYFEEVAAAQEAVQSFSSFVGERGPRDVLERLRRNILVAEGRTLWENGGVALAAAYVDSARDEATDEMRKVSLGVPSHTTFTSRTGSLDLSLFNETGYAIDARILLRALDMEFTPSTIDDTFPPGTSRISIEAEAQTSGTFPIEVRVETSNGYLIANEAVQVRSTEFNLVALTITLGAVAFLVIFYAVKALRRRRARESREATAG